MPDPAGPADTAWTLDTIDDAACAAALSPLFEGAPRFLARLVAARPFGGPDALFARARSIAQEMPEGEQLELIDAHPRLGAPAGSVSAYSHMEQGYGLDAAEVAAAADRERLAAHLERLNEAYETRFGFRYCVFVAGRPREALLPGTQFKILIPRRFRRAIEVLCTAKHCRPSGKGFIVGAEYAVVDIAADRYARLDDDRRRPDRLASS